MHPSSSPPSIVVLMSTYNGERFVVEQIRSILEQLPTDGRIIIRDDGSSDDTVGRILALQENRIELIRGENLGFAHSFLTLLCNAPPDSEVVMFADQDDVWLPGKINKARKALAPFAARPALYCSAQMLTDERLRPLGATADWPRPPSFRNALSENIVTGCTAALNPAAVDLLRRAGVPNRVRFHDWWLYLVVSAFGTVIYDREPTLLYRQHGGNHIGHGPGWWGRQWRILRFLRRTDWVGILVGLVVELRKYYRPSLGAHHTHLLDTYFPGDGTNTRPGWRLVFNCRRWRQFSMDEIRFRGIIAAYLLGLWPRPSRRLRN